MLIVFVIKLLFKKVNKNTLIYTRNPEIGWLFKKKGYRVIFEAHSLPKKKRLYKLLTKSIDYIVCNSKGTSEALIKCGLKNTIIAPNGVDLKDFNIVEDNEVLRRSLGLPADKKIIMYVGHLYKWKGVDVIIEAADDLRNNKDILFVLIGGQEKKINEYKEIVNTRKLKNILFLGYKKKNEISKFLKSSDILLLPNVPISIESLEYTSPIKMFEYMASLKPIIASDLPSIREVLNEETAKFIKAGSAVEMSNAIRIILENRELADNLAQSAHSKVKNFTWTKRAEFILNHVCQFNKSNTY